MPPRHPSLPLSLCPCVNSDNRDVELCHILKTNLSLSPSAKRSNRLRSMSMFVYFTIYLSCVMIYKTGREEDMKWNIYLFKFSISYSFVSLQFEFYFSKQPLSTITLMYLIPASRRMKAINVKQMTL